MALLKYLKLLTIILCAFVEAPGSADDGRGRSPLHMGDVSYYLDPSRAADFEAVRRLPAENWTKGQEGILELQGDSNLWLRFSVEADHVDVIFIENNWNSVISDARLYAMHADVVQDWQPLRIHASLFGVPIDKGHTTYLMQLSGVQSRRIKPRLRIYTAVEYGKSEGDRRQANVVFYGIAISMVLLCIAMMVSYRRGYFFYYIAYNVSMLLLLAIGSFHLANASVYLWPSLLFTNGLCAYLFMQRILDLRSSAPRLALSMDAVAGLFVLASGVEVFSGVETYPYVFQAGIYILGAVSAGVKAKRGSRPAIFLFAGWAAFTAGYIINTLGLLYGFPSSVMYAAYVGFAVESVLFTVALIFEAKQSETVALEQNDHAFKQLAKVFYPHQITRIRSGSDLEATMPVGDEEACVLCFDIVGSSAIRHEKAKAFFQSVFRHCNEVMNRSYDPQTLVANAYRVKEMGDGFICSVGFPFRISGDSLAKAAVRLAEELHAAFRSEVDAFGYHLPIHCCIGIAMDHVAGYFPETGTKSYDLYGRGIILATRYEGMRKLILSGEASTSMMILQEKVYASLDAAERREFVSLDLAQRNLTVRDDPDAKQVYYRELGGATSQVSAPLRRIA